MQNPDILTHQYTQTPFRMPRLSNLLHKYPLKTHMYAQAHKCMFTDLTCLP